MEDVEVEVKEFDVKKFFNKKIMLVGNLLKNEDSLADKALIYILKNQIYLSGSIIADGERIKEFYHQYYDNDEKIKPSFCYKRYTNLIKERIFRENTFFVLDNFGLNKKNLDDICENSTINMMVIFYYPEILNNFSFDYIILTEDYDDKILTLCYNIIEENYPFDYEGFLEIVRDFINDETCMVIDNAKQKIKCFELK